MASEQHETDVVVVGGGGAGLAAAVEARTLGRRVILLEKNERLGGSTALSVGSFTATNTPHQIRKGILDSAQHHFEDMGIFCARKGLPDNAALRRILVENAPETFRWLSRMGVVFLGPLPEPPHRKPRMHAVLPNSRAYIHHLSRHARKLGVLIKTATTVDDLIVEDGRVAGVRAGRHGRRIDIRAAGGVVLATGDFGGNVELRNANLPPETALARPANPTNTGDGHRMALALGGRILNAQAHLVGARFDPPPPTWLTSLPPFGVVTRFMAWAFDNLPARLLRPFVLHFVTAMLRSSSEMLDQGGLLINREGRRFADERDAPIRHIPKQPGECAYVLLDGRLARMFSGPPHYVSTAPGVAYAYLPDYRRNRRDIYYEAGTLTDLAGRLGIPAAALEQTVDDYNREAEAARAAGRDSRPAFGDGPYVALGPVRLYVTYTDSGVAVDDQHRVLDAHDRPIEGLYAAGVVGMGGVLLEGLGHHIGWAFTSGRRAGRHAAQRVVTADLPLSKDQ